MLKELFLGEILSKEKFLIIDSAIDLSKPIQLQLQQIFKINSLNFNDFKYEFINPSSPLALEKINANKNILVSTTFTTIKSESVEDLIYAGISHKLKDKNIFSLMPFQIVGSDFENYKNEVFQLSKNNVCFYFLSQDCTKFELYK